MLLDIMFREAEFFEQSNNLRTTRLLMEQNRLNLRSLLTVLDYGIRRQNRIYKRMKSLSEKNLISHQEFEEAQDDYELLVKQKALAIETYQQDSLFRKVQIDQLEAIIPFGFYLRY